MKKNLDLFQRLVLSSDSDLAHCALAIARLEYPELDLSKYLDWFERAGEKISSCCPTTDSAIDRVQNLNRFVFQELGFGPNTADYYDPKNSYLNDVIERRLGIPISLSVIYMELGKHARLHLQGVAFPGHYLIRNSEVPVFFIDAFNFGEILVRSDCESRFEQVTGGRIPFDEAYLQPATKIATLTRILANLKNIFIQQQRFEQAVHTLSWTIAIEPEVAIHFRDRGILLARMECPEAALKDLEHYLNHSPASREREQIEDLVSTLRVSKHTIH